MILVMLSYYWWWWNTNHDSQDVAYYINDVEKRKRWYIYLAFIHSSTYIKFSVIIIYCEATCYWSLLSVKIYNCGFVFPRRWRVIIVLLYLNMSYMMITSYLFGLLFCMVAGWGNEWWLPLSVDMQILLVILFLWSVDYFPIFKMIPWL